MSEKIEVNCVTLQQVCEGEVMIIPGHDSTPYSLWQKGPGNQIVGYSLAVKGHNRQDVHSNTKVIPVSMPAVTATLKRPQRVARPGNEEELPDDDALKEKPVKALRRA